MKTKIIVLIVSLIFAYSCKKNETTAKVKADEKVKITAEDLKKVEVKEVKKEEVKVEVKITTDDYVKFLATLNAKDIKSISKAVDYFNEKLKGVDVKISDNCFNKLNKFIDDILVTENERFEKTENEEQQIIYESTLSKATDMSKKATQKHKDYLKNLKDNCLFVDADGGYFINKDRELILKKIQNGISPTMKIFLTQNAKENKTPFWVDGGLTITPKELAERVLFWENFIKNNKDFVMITDKFVLELQNTTLILLTGVDNTSVFNYETEKLNDNFKEAYLFLIEKHPNSEVGKLVNSFYEILKKNEFKSSDESVKFIEEIPKG